MTLNDLRSALYDRLGFAQSPDAAVSRRLTAMLNESYREILGMKGFSQLRRGLVTFASTANVNIVAIAQPIARILAIADRTNNLLLQETSLQELRAEDPGLSSSSSMPESYTVEDYNAATTVDPTGQSELWIKSTSASDDATKTAYIDGLLSNAASAAAGNATYRGGLSVALNGTTAVQLSSTLVSFIRVMKFYIQTTAGAATTAAGTITLHEDSGTGTQLAQIGPGKASARYTRLYLYPPPTAAVTYTADVEFRVEDLANVSDEPLLPEDFHWLLVSGALVRELLRRENLPLHATEQRRFRGGIAELRAYLRRPSGSVSGGIRGRRWSQLGPYYPVGT